MHSRLSPCLVMKSTVQLSVAWLVGSAAAAPASSCSVPAVRHLCAPHSILLCSAQSSNHPFLTVWTASACGCLPETLVRPQPVVFLLSAPSVCHVFPVYQPWSLFPHCNSDTRSPSRSAMHPSSRLPSEYDLFRSVRPFFVFRFY